MRGADVVVDARVVAVKDNEQVVVGVGGVVYSFECEAAAYGGVAYYGHDIAFGLFTFELGGYRHSQRRRYGVGCMSGGKGVVIASLRVRESADAVLAAVAGESLAATCQQFVGICLVAYVPYQTVAGVSNT